MSQNGINKVDIEKLLSGEEIVICKYDSRDIGNSEDDFIIKRVFVFLSNNKETGNVSLEFDLRVELIKSIDPCPAAYVSYPFSKGMNPSKNADLLRGMIRFFDADHLMRQC